MKNFYYTPNQVWYGPRLRSRIRLRTYLDGLKAYDKGSLYDQIAKAKKVRVRMEKSKMQKGGENFFTTQLFKKRN